MADWLSRPDGYPRGGGGERIVSSASFIPHREHFIRDLISASGLVP